MDTEAGLILAQNLKLGLDEINWFQSNTRRNIRSLLLSLFEPGILVDRTIDGRLDQLWSISDDNDDGVVDVGVNTRIVNGQESALLIGTNGELCELRSNESEFPIELTLTNDNVWRTIIATPVLSEYELGTIAVTTASAVVTGTGTRFTRLAGYTGDGFNRGSILRISGSSNGNDGDYEIDSVASDGSLTLRTPVAGTNESGLAFRIVGDFATGSADPIHNRRTIEVSVIARTRVAPAGAFILYDAKRNDALTPKVALIDRREGSRARRRTGKASHGALTVQPKLIWTSGGATDVSREWYEADTQAGTDYSGVGSLAGTSDGSVSLVWHEGGDVFAKVFDHSNRTWGGGSTVDSTATVTKRPAMVSVPDASGKTHLAFYTNDVAGNAEVRSSADDTSTWSSSAIAWNPPTADPNDYVEDLDAILLRNHRVILIGTYYDDSAGQKSIRYVYSDDYGDTWQTNGGAGWELMSDSGGDDLGYPRIDQQPNGTIWICGENTTSGTVVLDRSVGEDLPDVDLSTGFAELSLNTPLRPVVYAGEDSVLLGYIEDAGTQAIIVCDVTEDASGDLGVGYQNQLFLTVADTAELDWWQGPDGQLHLLRGNNDTATRQLIHVPCLVVESRTRNVVR